MDTRFALMLEMADSEFDGDSLNGPSLMKTLDSLGFAEAASTTTYEGYSAWEIAMHCAYYKYLIARALGGGSELEPYPFATGNFPPLPESPDEAGWSKAKSYLRRAHLSCMETIRAAAPEKLDGVFAAWEMSFRHAISWLCTHDIYHNAQIRSMGIPSLKHPKES
jgi:hypothetical protein